MADGNAHAEAVRARYREALSRRSQAAPEAVQRALMDRPAGTALDAPAPPQGPAPGGPATPAGGSGGAAKARAAPTPLASLNAHIARAAGQPGAARPELRSAQAFHDSWSRFSAEDEVAQAVRRGPEAPGPLNSHRLVLHTLGLLSGLSPDYLRRFMAHAEALLWLDAASAQLKPAGRAARRSPPRSRAGTGPGPVR